MTLFDEEGFGMKKASVTRVPHTPVEPDWHIQVSQGRILALASKEKSFNVLKVFPFRSEAGRARSW